MAPNAAGHSQRLIIKIRRDVVRKYIYNIIIVFCH